MPVNLPEISSQILTPIKGIRLGWAQAHIKKANRKDLLVIEIAKGSAVSGVFTQNRFCAAPVTLCKAHLAAKTPIQALVINTGNANAGTGDIGMADAEKTCQQLAEIMAIPQSAILPFSTGVILEHLPMDKLLAGLPLAVSNLSADHWADAATTIMTPDVAPKAFSKTIEAAQGTVNITGISKGAGMIHPNMATMLGYLATDADISQTLLDEVTKEIADVSFNCISVDGDTSTNDSFIIIATGQGDSAAITSRNDEGFADVYQALVEAAQYLAKAIVRDGEGATKFVTVEVTGAAQQSDATKTAFEIAHSPLVKTALFASGPNWGRILAVVGRAGVEGLDVDNVSLHINGCQIVENGGRSPSYTEESGQEAMNPQEIHVKVDLGAGQESDTVWTTDFSHEYVTINAEYRT